MKLRLLHDWLLVRCEPLREKTSTGIILPLGGRVRTGTVVATGPGRYVFDSIKRIPLGIKVGDRISYFREHMEHQQGKVLKRHLFDLDGEHALIRVDDVLLSVPEGATVEIEEAPR
jgi:co-chaperonin GroES (HSP10)